MTERIVNLERNTKETQIRLSLNLDGTGKADISTGIPFFDHMLTGFARHGFFDLKIQAKGDTQVDSHHTIEDVGIVLGDAIGQAVGDKAGICRFGSAILPMDDALLLCAVDLSGRPYLSFDCDYTVPRLGDLDTEMIHDFFYAVSYKGAMNLHIKKISGFNNHHLAEGTFKAFAKALSAAVGFDGRIQGVLSTKGTL